MVAVVAVTQQPLQPTMSRGVVGQLVAALAVLAVVGEPVAALALLDDAATPASGRPEDLRRNGYQFQKQIHTPIGIGRA